MESAAVTTKGEDTAPVVADVAADNTTTTTDVPNPTTVTNEIVPPIKSDKEMITATNDVEHAAAVSDVADVSKETAITTVNATSNNLKVEEDQLNTAMASTTISANEVDEIKQKQDETFLDEKQKPVTGIVEKEIVINENSDSNLDTSLTKSEYDEIVDSTIGSGGFEDAVEYIVDDEENSVVKKQPQDVIQQENAPNNESCPQRKVEEGDGEDDSSEENKDPLTPAEPVVPVPVDDDTNDPQYIPRRGKFYEHDDRMAYSTTSSEGSESDDGYEEDSGDNDGVVSDRRRIRRRHTGIKKPKSVTSVDTAENTALVAGDGTSSTKKVLAISKVAAAAKDSETSVTADGLAKKPSVGSRKSRDLDSLDRWTHDLYDENEQTRKSRDELLASYGYDIREESEAPRARRHHKYGRAATSKYTRSWQDTKAYTATGSGQQSMKVKRGGMARRSIGGPNKNTKKSTNNDYTSEFPALDNSKKSEPNSSTMSPAVVEVSDQNHEQQPKTLSVQNEEKKTTVAAVETGQARNHTSSPRTSKYNTNSPANRNNRQDQQNGGPSSSSSTNSRNYFNRSSTESPINKEKSAQVNRDSPSMAPNNYFSRKSQQNSNSHNQHQHFKQQHFNNGQGSQGHNQQYQHSSPSASRGRNFHQHNTSHQYNRDRYFSKGSVPPSSSSPNQHNYDQQHQSIAPTTAGTGRTQHGGGHYQHYNNRQYENENQQIEPPAPPTPVVRSSKRYSVQSRRELPDPVLNFGGMSKTPQPQPPPSQQQNGLVMQDQQIQPQQQMQPAPQQLQQQPPIQLHQQPPPMQIQQYHQPLQPMHHGMVLDHNTGMMVMAAADPSMYHHQIYATPQYATGVAPGPAAGSADDQNAAAAAAAAALQMLAAQAAVYQPVPTGATGVTSPPPGTQSLQQPETFLTTYYQPQQQPQQQPPPRRVNLAIPIVAPPPEPNQQQGNSKTNLSTTPPPTTASTN